MTQEARRLPWACTQPHRPAPAPPPGPGTQACAPEAAQAKRHSWEPPQDKPLTSLRSEGQTNVTVTAGLWPSQKSGFPASSFT